ncbi:MAG: hypothetical protein LBI43_02515 [Streptococcaceae bacterium]|nr:hypothetical protein [Streptococcaceae bacterium]
MFKIGLLAFLVLALLAVFGLRLIFGVFLFGVAAIPVIGLLLVLSIIWLGVSIGRHRTRYESWQAGRQYEREASQWQTHGASGSGKKAPKDVTPNDEDGWKDW